jgi:hypothetical protein
VATDPTYLDVALPSGTRFVHDLPEDYTAFAYVYDGAARIDTETVRRGELAVLGPGERIEIAADGPEGARLILVAGRPLGEPIAKYGPFVMNTEAELRQAFADYRAGRL